MAVGNAINEQTTGICGFTGTAFIGTPATEHFVLIGGSTTSTIVNVTPSTAGLVLTSNGVSADPSFQINPGNFSPNSTINMFDDFMSQIDMVSVTPHIITGQLAWFSINNAGLGGPGFIPTNVTQNGHPGILSSSALTSSSNSLFLTGNVNNSAQIFTCFILGGGQLTINWVFNIVNLSTVTNRYILRLGLGDTLSADQANGVYFEYSDNINSGNWVYKTAAASSRTTTNSSTAVTTGWHNAQVVVNAAASSVSFSMDGVSLGAVITTNIPTTNGINPFIDELRTAGTIAAGTLLVDLMYLTQTLTTPR